MDQHKETVAVIIPALNEAFAVGTSIRSAWASGADEVIVADGGSSDGTRAIAANEGAVVVLSARGRGYQLNAGLKHTTAGIVLFLHADCQLGVGAIEQVRAAYRSQKQPAFGAFVQRIDARGVGYRLLEKGNWLRARWLGLPYGDQAIFCRRDTLLAIGGVPEVEIMEDVILARRLDRFGRRLILPGPVTISARRWKQRGIATQSLRNWMMLTAFLCGATPRFLNRFYPRHDLS